ncbi:hypothetical protein Trisim1_012451 [Trichoderma cf. simile WF8]
MAHEAAHHAGEVKRRTTGVGTFKGPASAPSATASAAASAAVGVSVTSTTSAMASASSALGRIRRRRNGVVVLFVVASRGRDFRWIGEWLAFLHGLRGRRRFIVLLTRGFTLAGGIHAGILREGMFVVARRAVEVVVEPVSPDGGSLIPPGTGAGSGRWRRRWMRLVRLMRLVWRMTGWRRRRSSEGEAGEAGEGAWRGGVVIYAVAGVAAVVWVGVVEGLHKVPEGMLLGRHDVLFCGCQVLCIGVVVEKGCLSMMKERMEVKGINM